MDPCILSIFILLALLVFGVLWRACTYRPCPLGYLYGTTVKPKTLDDLSLRQYPFLGTHDSATGGDVITTKVVPFTVTQSGNFDKQYEAGARFFDCRITMYGNGLHFHHGPVELSRVEVDGIFWSTLDRAVADKQLLLIYASHADTPQAYSSFIDLAQKSHIKDNFAEVSSMSDLQHSVSYYKQKGKYILMITGSSLLEDNYDSTITCYKHCSDCIACNSDTCMQHNSPNPASKAFDDLKVYCKDTIETKVYKADEHPKFQITQVFFQAANGACEIACAIQCTNGAIVNNPQQTAAQSDCNKIMQAWFRLEGHAPNIIIVDDLNPTRDDFDMTYREVLEDNARKRFGIPLPPRTKKRTVE